MKVICIIRVQRQQFFLLKLKLIIENRKVKKSPTIWSPCLVPPCMSSQQTLTDGETTAELNNINDSSKANVLLTNLTKLLTANET